MLLCSQRADRIFLVGGVPSLHVVETGCSLLIANGKKHIVRNSADQVADLIVVTNNRLARYFREAGRPAKPDSDLLPPAPEDIQRLVSTSEAFGYWIASPAESAAAVADMTS